MSTQLACPPVRILFASAFCLLLCNPAARAEKLLRWKFQQGDRLHVQLTQTSEQETRAGNRPLKMSIEMVMEMVWSVDSVDEQGNAQMTQSIERMALKMDIPQGDSIEFDSASTDKPTGVAKGIAESVRPLIGTKFRLTMNKRGEIVDVKLSDEAVKALSRSGATAKLKGLFTKEGITNTLQQSAAVLPEKPVNQGDTWNVTTNTKSPVGMLRQVHTYTYAGVEQRDGRSLAKITVESSLQLKKSKDDSDTKIKLKSQKQNGVLYFDEEAGRFVETSVTQKLTSETPYRDMVIQVKVNSSVEMKITVAASQASEKSD